MASPIQRLTPGMREKHYEKNMNVPSVRVNI